MIPIDMRSAVVTVSVVTSPPEAVSTSVERVEVPDQIDFYVASDRTIAGRTYLLCDSAEHVHRLGYEVVEPMIDRVLVSSFDLPSGPAILSAAIEDDLGNAITVNRQVDIVGMDPFALALGAQSIFTMVLRHGRILDVTGEASSSMYIRPATAAEGGDDGSGEA